MKFVVSCFLSFASFTAAAQSVATVPVTGIAQSSATRITVTFENTPLAEAVRIVAKRSGSAVIFSPSLVPNKKVTYKGIDVTPVEALGAILNGTPLRVIRAPDGALELVKIEKGIGQGVIFGKVSDAKTGNGISGATVSLGIENRATVTDAGGVYRISGIAAGVHTVSVRLVGYAKQSRSVTVGDGGSVVIDFKLEPSANVLDQVIVTGTVVQTELKAVPNAMTVITAKQIEERGITRIDQLFRGDIPGLFSMNLGSNASLDEVTMFSRGATALVSGSNGSAGTSLLTNPIKTYIDGIEMADSKYLSQIDPSSIERIEILTGPQASTIYGANAINGVMQIFTKRGKGSRPQLRLHVSGGGAENNFSNSVAPDYLAEGQVSGIEGQLSYNAGGSWNYVGSWTPGKQIQRLGANAGGRMEWSRFNADLSARQGLTRNHVRGDAAQEPTNLRATGVWNYLSTQGLPRPSNSTLTGNTMGVSVSLTPVEWWSHHITLGSDASKTETMKIGSGFASQSDTLLSIVTADRSRASQSYTSTLHIPVHSSASLSITLGGDHYRTRGSSVSANSLSLTGTLGGSGITINKPDKNIGAFLQGQLSLRDALFLTYGLRADWNPTFGDKAKSMPSRYGVSYTRDINTPLGAISTKLRGSYGMSIRPPGAGKAAALPQTIASLISLFGQYDQFLANPDLGPEHQQGGEGGVELYFGNRGSFVLTRYNQTVDNLISQVGSFLASAGPGLDSVRSLAPQPLSELNCSSSFRDADGYCFTYVQQYLNVGSLRNQGWEMQGSVNLGSLTTRGTYSWTKSRVTGVTPRYKGILTGTAFERGRPFDYLPEHTWAVGFTYAHSSSSLALNVNGTGARYIQETDLSLSASTFVRLPSTRPRSSLTSAIYRPLSAGYATADLNGTHRFSENMDAVIQITNFTDYYRNDLSVQYPTMGRQSRVGIRLRLQ